MQVPSPSIAFGSMHSRWAKARLEIQLNFDIVRLVLILKPAFRRKWKLKQNMVAKAQARFDGNLTTGPIFKTLLLFSLPTLGSSVLQSLNGSINAVWIGRILGEAALAATANANLVMFLMLGTVFGFGMAATILVGQAMGRGDIDGARRVVGASAFWFFFLSIIIAVLGWIFTPELLHLLDTPAASVPLAISYLRIIFLAIPIMFFLNFLMMAQRGAGDATTPLIFMGLSAFIDIILNPVLIMGLGPAPEMGIAGAATATFVAQAIALFGMLLYIYAKDLPIRLRGVELAYIRPARDLSISIITKGFPMGLQLFVVSGSAVVMIGFVNSYGVSTAAAYGVTAQLWSYIQMPAMALGSATSAMAAQNIGAGKWERVGAITRSGIIANIVLTGAMVLLLYVADHFALSLFLGPESPSIPIAVYINNIVSWGFILFGVMMVVFGTVRATGSVIPPLIIIFISLVGVRIGTAVLFEPTYGVEAVWWSYPISSAVSMALALAYYRFGNWRNATMISGSAANHEKEAAVPAENAANASGPT